MTRTNISIAAKFMMPDLALSQVQMGQIFSAFMLGYAIFQTPAGVAGDRIGPRAVLTLAATGWAALTWLTGALPALLAGSVFTGLLAVRFLLGVTEAAMYPVAGRAIAAWIPAPSRSFANSVVIGGLAAGSALTPPLVSWLMLQFGWRHSFSVIALLPLAVVAAWWHFAPRPWTPETASGASWWTLLRNRDIGVLSVSYFLESYIQYIFLFWFFLYLVDVRGFTILKGGFLTGVPYLVAIVSMPLIGHLSDRLSIRHGKRIGRAGVALGALVTAALFLIAGTLAANPYAAIAGISLSVGFVLATEGPFWATAADLAGPHAGAAGGLMNTAGNLAGVASTALVPVLVSKLGWPFVFYSAAALSILAGLLWLFLRLPSTRVESNVPLVHQVVKGEIC